MFSICNTCSTRVLREGKMSLRFNTTNPSYQRDILQLMHLHQPDYETIRGIDFSQIEDSSLCMFYDCKYESGTIHEQKALKHAPT